jgi:hypothetical protein
LFLIFVVDLLHEVELGVWKALFIHILRILEAVDENLLHELDRRLVYYDSNGDVILSLAAFDWCRPSGGIPFGVSDPILPN